ncbi:MULTISPECIES: hypothetical protein [Sorangium]|uniref:Uncharacterized protein n=1 Tax=Sorangium cellulosum (strain So ce56) TaxID=448385 RepID=A9G2Z9_SORC5|nr:hypothetical protein [Sorangium cellulosum]CAN95706.1 hypothetical protein predicted by Glimmer/Critica [Sorangium cellulosum So ce56]
MTKQYVDAVIRGDFQDAQRIFERLPQKGRLRSFDPGQILVEHRADYHDRVLTWLGVEGMKGAWRAAVNGRWVLYGFDDNIVLSPCISADDQQALVRHGFVD